MESILVMCFGDLGFFLENVEIGIFWVFVLRFLGEEGFVVFVE